MVKASIVKLVTRRQYPELEKRANEYIETDDWKRFLTIIKSTPSKGKARDAVVNLLKLEAVGGTDSDVFKEFSSIEGDSFPQIIANSRSHAMNILKEQIENRHTYFMDIEAMTMSPYVILVKDVIEARKRELAQLEKNPDRIDVLGTFYGFSILMIEGSKPHENTSNYGYYRWRRRTWLDEKINDNAAIALRQLTKEFAQEVNIDKRYRTLGSSRVFKDRCTRTTAKILADAVRLALYKVPGNRGKAAKDLGYTEDSRTLLFLHHRLAVEESRRVRMSIIDALGRIGHDSSIDILREKAKLQGRRYMTKEGEAAVKAIGGIFAPQCRETLIDLLNDSGNMVKAASIYALSKQESTGLVQLISPYLLDRSRPVVRASVISLTDLGSQGREAIKTKATGIIKRIGYDRPSRNALIKMLSISGVGSMESVQQYFGTRITKLRKEVERWQNRSRSSYGYYWTRREQRAKQKLIDYIRLASTYLRPPYDNELVSSIRSVFRQDTIPSVHATLGQSQLAQAVMSNKEKAAKHLQTVLSSFR